MLNTIIQGDCYELMKEIPDGSIDAVISDFPYNTTQAAWDKQPIDLPLLWKEFGRIVKPNGAIVTTTSQPFTTVLIASNYKWFRHEWVWIKDYGSNFLNAKREPIKEHETVLVFSQGGWTYNPQRQIRSLSGIQRNQYKDQTKKQPELYGEIKIGKKDRSGRDSLRLPSSHQKFNRETGHHPTQKPVALFDYLIRTYSNPGETVLDPFAGSGTTALAAHATGRQFLLFEKEPKYVEIANKRLALAQMQGRFEEMVG